MLSENIQAPSGMISMIKFYIQRLLSKMNIKAADFIKFLTFFGFGFFIGLFVKKYSKYIIMAILFSAFLLSFLNYFHFITINQIQIKLILGFSETETFDIIFNSFFKTIQLHLIEFGVGLLGCLVGFKIG